MYTAIPGEERSKQTYYETPQSTMAAIASYTSMQNEVKETLLPVLNGLDSKVVQPSMDMRKALEQVQKMVKKRHHKKVDYDRFTASVVPVVNGSDVRLRSRGIRRIRLRKITRLCKRWRMTWNWLHR
jgi:amphiphysin